MRSTNEDIVDMLLAQHHQLKVLFAQVDSATGEHKERLFEELVGLLAVHESVEETVVHPLAEHELADGDAVVSPRLAEEQDAKAELARLYDVGVHAPEFRVGLADLRDAVQAHAEAEETLEFIRLREVVDPEKLTRMAGTLRMAAALSPTRPHPDVPPGQVANLLMGPPLAVFDRVRDAVRDALRESA